MLSTVLLTSDNTQQVLTVARDVADFVASRGCETLLVMSAWSEVLLAIGLKYGLSYV